MTDEQEKQRRLRQVLKSYGSDQRIREFIEEIEQIKAEGLGHLIKPEFKDLPDIYYGRNGK